MPLTTTVTPVNTGTVGSSSETPYSQGASSSLKTKSDGNIVLDESVNENPNFRQIGAVAAQKIYRACPIGDTCARLYFLEWYQSF
jgi:hypothetical protein